MQHRIREAWKVNEAKFSGPVEVDETYVGGLEKNKHGDKKLRAGRGGVGKTPVLGMLDRETNQVKAVVIETADGKTLKGFVFRGTSSNTAVYTDEHRGYIGVGIHRNHEAVSHSAKEYVREDVSTNGIEAFWSLLKRAHKGTYHKMSKKHLQRYVNEFTARHNRRALSIPEQMAAIVREAVGKRLGYRQLVAG